MIITPGPILTLQQVDISQCSFLVDSYFPGHDATELEPPLFPGQGTVGDAFLRKLP
jgi:hypothetical protein